MKKTLGSVILLWVASSALATVAAAESLGLVEVLAPQLGVAGKAQPHGAVR